MIENDVPALSPTMFPFSDVPGVPGPVTLTCRACLLKVIGRAEQFRPPTKTPRMKPTMVFFRSRAVAC